MSEEKRNLDFEALLKSRKGLEGEGMEYAEKQVEERAKEFARRVWMKPEEEAVLVFISDDADAIIDEHQAEIDGSWRNWFTCLRQLGEECPLCEAKNYASTVGFFTVIDTREWDDSLGETHKNEKSLLAAKFSVLKKLKQIRRENGGSLRGLVIRFARPTDRSPSTGIPVEILERLSEDQLAELNDDLELFDLATILAPKTPSELKEILSAEAERRASSGSTGTSGGGVINKDPEVDPDW